MTTSFDELRDVARSAGVLQREVAALMDRGQENLTEAQIRSLDHKIAELVNVNARESELRADAAAALSTMPNLERLSGDGATRTSSRKGTKNVNRTRHYDDPWDYRTSPMGADPQELRDRALSAIDEARSPGNEAMVCEPEDRARIDKLIRSDRHGDVSQYVVAASRPQYETAYHKHLTGRTALWTDDERAAVAEIEATRIREESRAALSTVGSNGGFMIPFFLDPTVILTNASVTNPFRQICKVATIPTNVWHGVSSAGVTAEWTSEASEFTDASPTFAQPTITPIRADAYVQASWEVAMDAVNLANELGMIFADAKNVLEGAAFATGTGSTQPEGIVTRLNVTTASKVAANTNGQFNPIDVYAVDNALPPRAIDSAVWIAPRWVYNLARQFAGTALNSSLWVELGGGLPAQLIGRNAYVASAMANAGGTTGLSAATASNDNILICGDFSRYQIVDRIGMEIIDVPVVIGSNRRPTGERAWAAWWRTGGDTTDASQFRMLQV